MHHVTLPDGATMPSFGLGTAGMGERGARRSDMVAALRLGMDLGVTLIDTAEMYGDGGAESIVGEAITGRRSKLFLVSKVLPEHATRRGTVSACEQSLKRLRTDYLDLFLLHWRGDVPLAETLAGFADLKRAGKIRRWGVSNFDVQDFQELWRLAGDDCAVNQVLYNLGRRGVEWGLLPTCRARGIPIMAYSPLEQGRLLARGGLKRVAERRGKTPAQVAIAWLLRQEGVVVIPKAARLDHLREIAGARDLRLETEDLEALDTAFPPPAGPSALETI
jgi:diketogulonate reductase-like aldo/keto reductase